MSERTVRDEWIITIRRGGVGFEADFPAFEDCVAGAATLPDVLRHLADAIESIALDAAMAELERRLTDE